MSDRDRIISKLRKSLSENSKKISDQKLYNELGDIKKDNLIKLLKEQCTMLEMELVVVSSFKKAVQYVDNKIKELHLTSIGLFPDEMNWPQKWNDYFVEIPLISTFVKNTSDERVQQISELELAITGVDAIIAQTGTLVLKSSRLDGRLGSILPPRHWIIASSLHIYPTLSSVIQSLSNDRDDKYSCLTFVSGPSRTADIEKQLIIGVHGPLDVKLFLINSAEKK